MTAPTPSSEQGGVAAELSLPSTYMSSASAREIGSEGGVGGGERLPST
jgi:hypothetical protein